MAQSDLVKLTAETMALLDGGKLKAALEIAFEAMVKNCLDRPTDKRARSVVLKFEMVPTVQIEEEAGQTNAYCDGVSVQYTIQRLTPAVKCNKPLDFAVTRTGQMLFNEHSPDNYRQGSLLAQENDDE